MLLCLLPVFDIFALVCAFESIRIAGSGYHQTVGGASIPISCLLNVLLTGRSLHSCTFSAQRKHFSWDTLGGVSLSVT